MTWRRTLEAGLGPIAAGLVLLVAYFYEPGDLRGLETTSLDLRFRLRGVEPPASEITLILVDDASLSALGRWPLSRRIFARAVDRIRDAGAKVIAFDVLFTEPEESIPAELRAAASGEGNLLSPEERQALRTALNGLSAKSPDAEFAKSIASAGNVLLPLALIFTGMPNDQFPVYADNAGYAQFDRSLQKPIFPLRPVAPLLPIPELAKAAAALGHVNVAYDLDGMPRYDYLALPLGADFVASLPIHVAAAYLDVPWSRVSIALGAGVHVGPLEIPTDRAMRLLINYRGPRGTFPTYSFADLMAGGYRMRPCGDASC